MEVTTLDIIKTLESLSDEELMSCRHNGCSFEIIRTDNTDDNDYRFNNSYITVSGGTSVDFAFTKCFYADNKYELRLIQQLRGRYLALSNKKMDLFMDKQLLKFIGK